jgi:hypothetical protein
VTLPEIQKAIQELPEKEQWKFKEWLDEFMADQWDREIERDAAAGKFDKMNAKVDADMKAGRSKPL